MTHIPLAYRIRALAGTPMRHSMHRSRRAFLAAAHASCRDSQRHVLKRLLRLNQESQFSRDFGLNPSMSLQEFRQQIPVSDYELVRPYVEKVAAGDHAALLGAENRLLMFAITSGTTAEAKLIPVTSQFLNDYRRGWQMWGIGAYSEHAVLQKLNILQVSSSHQRFYTAGGTPCGNISGLVASMQNPLIRTLYTIPAAVAEITETDSRRYAILRLALADPHIGMLITANPSTLLQLTEFCQSHVSELIRDINDGTLDCPGIGPEVLSSLRNRLRPNRLRARELESLLNQHGQLCPHLVWPRLGLLGVWCGGSAGAYIPRLKENFQQTPVRDHGLHASEGRMTLPLNDESPAGVLEVQTHFFEFLPVDCADSHIPDALEAHELQEGKEYFILLTTSSGLYRYNIRDVVRCTGYYGSTPILEFLHKGAHISSITGEKLAESQVVEAVRRASESLRLCLIQYTLTPRWGNPPEYVLFVQLPDGPPVVLERLEQFAVAFDSALRQMNIEYADKRATGRLNPIRVCDLPRSDWQRFTEWRMARAGGSPEQYKHPCLFPDPTFQGIFQAIVGSGDYRVT
jgi:hypothetical protein